MADDIISLDERRRRLHIVEGGPDLTIKNGSLVTIKRAISFRLQGVEVGYLDAVYDFKTMPPDYHSLALQCLLARGGPLLLHLDALVRAETSEPARPPPKLSWWRRWWSRRR